MADAFKLVRSDDGSGICYILRDDVIVCKIMTSHLLGNSELKILDALNNIPTQAGVYLPNPVKFTDVVAAKATGKGRGRWGKRPQT